MSDSAHRNPPAPSARTAHSAQGELKVRIAGIGGQGAVLLGDVLGHAAVLAGLNSATSTIYGSQARGGASRSDVIISTEPIDFPHVVHPQVLMALAQESYDESLDVLVPGGTIVYDEFFVNTANRKNDALHLYGVPATKTVLDRLNASQPANFYMLGATVGLFEGLSVIPAGSLERAVELHVRKRFVEVNHKALHMGLERGRSLRKEGPHR